MLRRICESGPDAFRKLVDICQSNKWDAADFLSSFEKPGRCGSAENQTELVNVETDGNIVPSMNSMSIANISLELYTKDVAIDETMNVKKAVRFCSTNVLPYSMRSKNRGVLFLVNIIDIQNKPDKYRNGAMWDKIKLITLFREFGFKIFYYENLTLRVSL